MADETGANVGSAFIDVVPSAQGFSVKLAKELKKHGKVFQALGVEMGDELLDGIIKETKKRKPKVKPDLDDEKVRKDYEKLKDDIEKDKATVQADADTASAEAQLQAASRTRWANIKAKIDQKSLAGVKASLAALTGGRAVKNVFQPVTDSMKNLDKNVPKIAMITGAIALLGSTALASTGGLLALGASLAQISAAGLLLPGIFAGGAVAALTFGLALSDASKVLGDLGPKFKALKTEVSGNFWAQAETPIRNMINTLLPQFQSQMAVTATALGDLAGKFTGELTQAIAGVHLDKMFTGLNGMIKNLEAGIPGVTTAIQVLGVTGASYLPRMGAWISNISNRFGAWLQQAQASGALNQWIETALVNLRALGSVVASTGSILNGLFQASEAAGFGGLTTFADVLSRIAQTVNGPAFQGALTTVLIGAKDAMNGLSPAVGALGDMFVNLAPVIGAALGSLGSSVGAVLTSVFKALGSAQVATGLNAMIQGISAGFHALAPAIESLAPVIGAVFRTIGAFAGAIFPIIGAIASGLAPVVTQILGFVAPLVTAIGSFLLPIVSAIVGFFARWYQVLLPIAGAVMAAVVAFRAIMFVKAVIEGIRLAMIGLNLAIAANPVVAIVAAIIAAITLLVIGFMVMYNKVDWFRNMVNAVWAGIKLIIQGFVLWFQTYVVPIFKLALQALGAVFRWLWVNVIQPVWNGIKLGISLVVLAIRTYINIWVAIFRNILAPVFKWIYNSIVKPVFRGIKTFIVTILNGLKLAFQVFKTAVSAVWNALKNAINATWIWIRGNIFNKIKLALIVLKIAFQTWKAGVAAVWKAVKSTISSIWNWIKKNVFTPIKTWLVNTLKSAFNGFKNTVSTVFSKVKGFADTLWSGMKAIFGKLKDGASAVGKSFQTMKNTIKSAFEKARDTAKKPVKAIIGFVNDPLIKGINKVGNIFKLKDIPTIKMPKGFAKGGAVYGGAGSVGGYTGSGRKFEPAGVVHRGEYVVKKSATQKIQRKAPGLLNSLNSGRVPGFAKGGSVGGTLSDGARWLQAKGVRIEEFGAWGQRVGRHSNGSLHYSGKAFDANYGPGGQNSTEMNFFDRVLPEFHRLFPKLRTLWRVPGHYNHLHVDTGKGGIVGSGGSGAGGGFVDILDLVPGLKSFKDKMKEKIGGDSPFGKMIVGAGDWMFDGIKGWMEKMNPFSGGSGGAGVEQWRGLVETALGIMNIDATKSMVDTVLRRMNQESSGNPSIVNNWDSNAKAGHPSKGLMQVIQPTYDRWKHPKYDKGLLDPLSNILASMRYAIGKYGSLPAAYNKKGGYAGGGLVKAMKMDNGGWLPKGDSMIRNATSSPERIRTMDEELFLQRAIAQSNQRYQEQKGEPVKIDIHVNGAENPTATANAVANKFNFEMRRRGVGAF